VDYVRKTLETSYALIKARGQEIFMATLKISVVQVALGLAALLVIGGLAVLLLGASITETITSGTLAPSLMRNLGVGIAIALPIIAIAALAGAVLKSVSFNIVDNAAAGRTTDLVACTRKNMLPVVKLYLVLFVITIVLAVPAILSFLIGALGGMAGVAAVCILWLVSFVALVLLALCAQFSTAEVVLNGKGPVEAIRSSLALVRGSIGGVILLDVAVVVVAMAVGMVSGIVQRILGLALQVFAVGGGAALVAGFVVYAICMLVIYSIVGAISETLIVPLVYNFWKGKKG